MADVTTTVVLPESIEVEGSRPGAGAPAISTRRRRQREGMTPAQKRAETARFNKREASKAEKIKAQKKAERAAKRAAAKAPAKKAPGRRVIKK